MTGHALAHWRTVAVTLLGAGLWCVPFLVRLRSVPRRHWIARDDGIITLSHARNLADHGTVGVSPGGDRVEGFSSPLHFAVGFVIETFADPTADTASLVIFGVALAFSGACVAYGVLCVWRRQVGAVQAVGASLATVTLTATIASLAWTTTGWLASGMENPLVLAAGSLIVAAALGGLERVPHRVVAAVGLSLLLLSRVEFAALGAPLTIALFVAALDATPGPARARLRAAIAMIAAPLAAVALVHVVRRWYFGAWLPNTAIVQDRDAGTDQIAVIGVVAVLFALLVIRSRPDLLPRSMNRRFADRALGASVAVVAVALLWLDASGRTAVGLTSVLVIPGVLPFGAVVAAGLAVRRLSERSPMPMHHWVMAGVVLVPLTQYVVTGAARLDDNRVSGLAVPFLVVWATIAVIDGAVAARSSADLSVRRAARARGAIAATVVIVLAACAVTLRDDRSRPLRFEIAWATDIAGAVADFGDETFAFDERSGAPDPPGENVLVITATPDLGKLSYEKRAGMVDLGWLGDPVLATIRSEHPDLLDAYLLRIARPDVVSTHSGWSCEYRGFLEHPQFVEEYTMSASVGDGDGGPWVRGPETCPNDGRLALWSRQVDGGEYELTRRIAWGADPVGVVRAALADCLAADGDELRCQAVRRSVQRAAPVLIAAGSFDEVAAEFVVSPSASFDIPMLERDPGWWEPAGAAAVSLLTSGTTG